MRNSRINRLGRLVESSSKRVREFNEYSNDDGYPNDVDEVLSEIESILGEAKSILASIERGIDTLREAGKDGTDVYETLRTLRSSTIPSASTNIQRLLKNIGSSLTALTAPNGKLDIIVPFDVLVRRLGRE